MTHRADRNTNKTPTQVDRPWRSTARAVAIVGLALLPALPEIADTANIDTVPFVASVLTIAAALQRIITIPAVDALLARWHLGAQDRKDYENDLSDYAS